MQVQSSHVPLEDTHCTQHIILTIRHIIPELQTWKVYSKIKTQDNGHQANRKVTGGCLLSITVSKRYVFLDASKILFSTSYKHPQPTVPGKTRGKKSLPHDIYIFFAGSLRHWNLYHSFILKKPLPPYIVVSFSFNTLRIMQDSSQEMIHEMSSNNLHNTASHLLVHPYQAWLSLSFSKLLFSENIPLYIYRYIARPVSSAVASVFSLHRPMFVRNLTANSLLLQTTSQTIVNAYCCLAQEPFNHASINFFNVFSGALASQQRISAWRLPFLFLGTFYTIM